MFQNSYRRPLLVAIATTATFFVVACSSATEPSPRITERGIVPVGAAAHDGTDSTSLCSGYAVPDGRTSCDPSNP